MALEAYRSPTKQARTLTTLLWINLGFTAFAAANDLMAWAPFGATNLRTGYQPVVLISLLVNVVFYLITGIFWMLWTRTCYRNLAAFGMTSRYRPAWIFWGWVIPIANFWIPFRLTEDLSVSVRPWEKRTEQVPSFSAWWALYIVSLFTSRIASVSVQIGSDFSALPALFAIVDVALVVAAVGVVTQITHRHDRRFANEQAAGPGPTLEERLSGASLQTAAEPAVLDESESDRRDVAMTAVKVGGTVFALSLGLALTVGYDIVSAGTNTSVDDLAAGDCIVGGGASDIAGVVVVPCDEPHDSQVVGVFDLPVARAPYAGRTAVVAYASDSCRGWYEVNTGKSSFVEDRPLRLIYPSPETWRAGDRRVVCTVGPGDRTKTDDLHAPTDRVVWEKIDAGGCYLGDFDFLSLQPVDCERSDFVVEHVIKLDPEIGIEYPGIEPLRVQALEACRDLESSAIPTPASWEAGDRQIVCFG